MQEGNSEGEDSEYEYEDYSEESTDIQVFVNPEDLPDKYEDGQAKVEERTDGMVSIANEDRLSAFDIDINKLRIKKWEMTGEESDYFNYGLNEAMWKVVAAKGPHESGLRLLRETASRTRESGRAEEVERHADHASDLCTFSPCLFP